MLRKTREFLFLHTIGILEKNIAKRKIALRTDTYHILSKRPGTRIAVMLN